MTVQAVDEALDARFVQVSDIGSRLSRLLSQYDGVGVNQPESINNDLSRHGLNGVDDDGHSTRLKLLEALLCVDVDAGQPAAETRMRMIPSHHHFGSFVRQ